MEAGLIAGARAQPVNELAPLKVFLLGRFEVVRGSTPIPAQAWRRRRPADLLKLVALASGRRLARDEAVDALWPDKDPASGANNLHRALYDLRQILGGRFVDLERGRLCLRADAWVDVEAFEAAAGAGTPDGAERAVALYKGDLSPDDIESPWLESRRRSLRRLFAATGFPLVCAAAERGDPGAVGLLQRLLDVDAANEEGHRMLMRLLAETGRRVDALRQFDACEQALRAAGLAVSPETRGLREAVQAGEVGPIQGRPPYDGWRRTARRLLGIADPLPLRGQAAALLVLESLVEQGSGALFLLGERGVGKTRLAVEGARLAQERGGLVLAGTGGGAGSPPYSLLQTAWTDYREAAGLLTPDPFAAFAREASAGPEERKRRLFEEVERSLAALAGGRAIYLVLEDVHLCDESSANLVHWLARRAPEARLMMVATVREDEVRAGSPVQMLLSHLDCGRLARGIRVQRLGSAATREQVGDLLGQMPSADLAEQIYRVTNGNPFYTEEVARALKETGRVPTPGGPAAAVRARIARLGPRADLLLGAAAVAGRRFDLDVVRPVTGLTAHDALAALEDCLEARLLEADGAGYHFHHSLVRDAVYESLPEGRRAALHRAVADALEARAAASGELREASEALAHHRHAGGDLRAAFHHLVAAGDRAEARAALSEALACYGQAMRIADAADATGAECFELRGAAGRVQIAVADLAGAGRTFEAVGAAQHPRGFRPSTEQRARARRWEALALLAGGHPEEADRRLEAALADATATVGDELAEALLLRSQIQWHAGAFSEAVALGEHCATEAMKRGVPELAARGREMALLARASRGEAAEPPRARRDDEEAGEPPFDVHLALFERDLMGERPLRSLAAAAALMSSRTWNAAAARAVEGAVALEEGRFDVAEVALREAAERHRALGRALGEAFALERLGVLLTARGRIDEALDVLGMALLVAERSLLRRHALTRVHAALARNRLAAASTYAAEDAARQASETFARHGDCAICAALLRPELVRVALARGRPGEGEAEARELEALASRRPAPTLGAQARLARGRVLAAQGRIDEALGMLGEAQEAFAAAGAAWEAARCLGARACALEAAGEPRLAEARAARAEADAALSALGPSATDA